LADLIDLDRQDDKALSEIREALVSSEWMTRVRDGYEIPGVAKWIETREKEKASNRERQDRFRQRHGGSGGGNALVTGQDKRRGEDTGDEIRGDDTTPGGESPVVPRTNGKSGPSVPAAPRKRKEPSTEIAIQEGRAAADNAARAHDDRDTILAKYDDGRVNHVGLFIHIVRNLGGISYSVTPQDAGQIKAAHKSGIHPRDLADAYVDMANGKLDDWVMDHLDMSLAIRKFNSWQEWRRRNDADGSSNGAYGVAHRGAGAGVAGATPPATGPVGPGVGGADRYASNAQDARDLLASYVDAPGEGLFGDEDQGDPGAGEPVTGPRNGGPGRGRVPEAHVLPGGAPTPPLDGERGAGRNRRPRTWVAPEGGVGAVAF
jgi:hypothetical protein